MIKFVPAGLIRLTNAGKNHPAVGEKFFSKYFNCEITVSRAFGDNDWYFTKTGESNAQEYRSGVALSFLQKRKMPKYSETRRRAVTKHRADLNAIYERAANECIAGIYLNGEQRIKNLRQVGFSDAQIAIIQSIVNQKKGESQKRSSQSVKTK